MIPVKDILTKDLKKEDVLAVIYDGIGTLIGYPLANQPGEPTPAIVDSVVSWAVDKVWNPIVRPALCAPFYAFNAGEWLALMARSDRDINKIEAVAATGTLVMENRGSFNGTLAIGQVRVRHATTNKTYTNTTAGSLVPWIGSGAYPTCTLTFEADEEGTGSNADIGAIAAYPTAPTSAPVNVFARTNAAPWLGSDAETDDRLRARAVAAPGELSPGGPKDAYLSVAMDPIGAFTRRKLTPPVTWGTAAPAITRVQVVEPGGAVVNVYLASDSGPAGGDAMTDGTDVYKAATVIQMFVRPPGVTCNVYPARAHAVAIGTLTLYVKASPGLTAAGQKARADAALGDLNATLPVGGVKKTAGGSGYVFASHVRTIAEQAAGAFTSDMTFVDELLADGDVAQLSWTVAVNLVAQ